MSLMSWYLSRVMLLETLETPMKSVETQTQTKSSTSGQHTASLQHCRAHWSLMLQQKKCGWQLFQLCSSLLRRINSPAPQKKRHDPQEQYSLKYWICCKYQLQLWKLHCEFQGMRPKCTENTQFTLSLTIQGPKKESPNTKKSGKLCEYCLIKIKTEEAVGSAIYSNQNRDKIYKTNFPEQFRR